MLPEPSMRKPRSTGATQAVEENKDVGQKTYDWCEKILLDLNNWERNNWIKNVTTGTRQVQFGLINWNLGIEVTRTQVTAEIAFQNGFCENKG